MNLTSQQLHQAANIKERIEILSAELYRVLSGRAPVIKTTTKHRGRTMSPEAKAKISAAAKLRWRKARAKGQNHL